MSSSEEATLASESMCESQAQIIAKQTVETIVKMRTDAMFNTFSKHTLPMKEKTNSEDLFSPRKRRAPRRTELGESEAYQSRRSLLTNLF